MRQRYPKILPWVAGKAGVRGDKAEVLWMAALRDASEKCAAPESSEYWKMAVSHLLASLARRARTAPAVTRGARAGAKAGVRLRPGAEGGARRSGRAP